MSFSRKLSRCVVTVQVSICEEPDGAGPEVAPEVWLQRRLAASGNAIEVLFDELEHEGRRFPADGPAQKERVDWDVYSCSLEVISSPAFSPEVLSEVARRVATLVFENPDDAVVTDPGGPGGGRDLEEEPTDPESLRGAETKASPSRRRGARKSDEAPTPIGVPAVERGSDLETPLETTPVGRRPEEVPTRPVGVPSIKRPTR
jgi:hypothetical protein